MFRGGKAYQFNEKEKTLRVFLRGRPIVHHTPDDYDPESNAPSPSHQLDLNWVYGYRGKGKCKTPKGFCKKVYCLLSTSAEFPDCT